MRQIETTIEFCLSLILLLFIAIPLHAANGVFMVVKGDIKIEAPGKAVSRARVGMKVLEGSKIVAGKDSRAKIVMSDKNILNISPDSHIVIEKYEYNPSKNNKNVTLKVLYGKIRSTVNQKYDGERNKFQVKTPTAVAGVRGTDFLSQYNQRTKSSQFVTFKGQVQVGQLDTSGRIVNAVVVNAGHLTTATNGSAPSTPTPVPQQTIQQLDHDSNTEPTPPARQDVKNELTTTDQNEEPTQDNVANQEMKSDSPKEPANEQAATDSKSAPAPGTKPSKEQARSPSPSRDTASTGPSPTAPPPPSMLDRPTAELPQGPVQPIFGPIVNAPPPVPEVYKPPELAPDIIQQQRTLLKINIVTQ